MNSTPPLITAPRARKLLALLSEQMHDQDDALNDATDAHLLRDDKGFYSAMSAANGNRALVARALNYLAQGEYEAAERLFRLDEWTKKK